MDPTQTQPQAPSQAAGSSYTATDGTQLNPTAVNLAKAIRSVESNGNYNAVGDNGQSHGAYQFNKDNFGNWASEYGLNPSDTSPVNQDKVAYARINGLLQKGIPPSQVAAIWNGAKYTNGQYQAINPAYVDKVKNAYQQQLSGGQSQSGSMLAPGVPALQLSGQGQNQPQGQDKGFLGNLMSGNLGGAAGDAGNFLFPIVGDVGGDINGTNKKSFLQQAGDLGTSALSGIAATSLLPEGLIGAGATGVLGALTGAGAESALGRIGGQAAFGGAMGLSSALGQGQTDPTKLAESTGLGGLAGGVAGGAGELLGKAAQYLPKRIVGSFLKTNPDTIDYAINKGLGSLGSMSDASVSSIDSLGKTLGAALTHPQYDGVTATANDILPNIIKQFPNAGLTPESTAAALMKVAPLQKTLIEKLTTGEGLNLDELHTLNSAIGANTYKSVFDDPVMKAGKQLGNAFYSSASNFIKTQAPETAPLFDQLSKEYSLGSALQRALKTQSKTKMFTLRDLILPLLAGMSPAGVVGGAATFAGEKLLNSPTANLNAAGLISKLAPRIPSMTTPVTGLISRLVGQSQ